MSITDKKYCLDANVLIQAWQKYYSPKVCPAYWDVLNSLGAQSKIFMPEIVYEEIVRTEDDLSKWLKASDIPVRKIDENVTKCLQSIYSIDPNHKFLVERPNSNAMYWGGRILSSDEVPVMGMEQRG